MTQASHVPTWSTAPSQPDVKELSSKSKPPLILWARPLSTHSVLTYPEIKL